MTEETEQKIVELRKKGYGYKRVARIVGEAYEATSKVLIDHGMCDHIKMPEEAVVQEIVDLYVNQNLGTKAICKEMHIAAETVRNILRIKGVKLTPSAYHRGYEKKIDHFYFHDINDEHKAYWLGFLYADGYNNEKMYQVEITLKEEDKHILEELREDTSCSYRIYHKDVELLGKIFPEERLTMYSKQMSEDLARKGCHQAKTLDIVFPDTSIVPIHLQPHFMRGYFDGDGCISGSKFMLNGTKAFLNSYIDILKKNTNISDAGSWNMDGQAYRWQHAAKIDLRKIYDYLYDEGKATIYLKRKQKRFLV